MSTLLTQSRWDAAFMSDRMDWETPADLFELLHREFRFTLDVCALPHNAKLPRYFTPELDGLAQDWGQDVCWCNPPYGDDIGLWIRKAYEASLQGATVVCLTYARTDTQWFHDWAYGKAEIRFIKGRVRFVGAKHGAPAPSILLVYRPAKKGGD
jgi:phage N-6-adenine-methyltransferase